MRSAKLSVTSGKLGWAAVAIIALGFGAGCNKTVTNPNKGLLDPTAVGRFQRDPLVVPILNYLDRTVEEPDDQFGAATEVRPEDLVASTADYAIQPNDLLSITISDLVGPGVETVKTTRVSESGNISLPLIGPVRTVGLSEAELEQAISDAYRQANLIQNAQVSVIVAEARGRSFSILGSVVGPGQYPILNSDFRVLDALVLARDVTMPGIEYLYVVRQAETAPAADSTQPTAPAPRDVLSPEATPPAATLPTTSAAGEGRYVTVDGKPVLIEGAQAGAAPQAGFEFNGPAPATSQRVIRVPLERLKNGELKYNVVILPRDMIIVPAPVTGEYYMAGHVARVGVYSLTARKVTLKEAIASAGMFDAIAVPEQTDIIRRIGGDRELFVRVNLDKIFAGEQPDIFLKPYDQVNVGTNALAPFLAAVRGAFRFTYGFGFLYDRNYAYDENGDLR